MPGRHLVVVRYGPAYDPGHQIEWVYNRADIDHAKVIWAREMGDVENTRLLEYYRHRHPWLIEPDRQPVHLRPYLSSPRSERPGDSQTPVAVLSGQAD